jgi:glycogen(starch) synthase
MRTLTLTWEFPPLLTGGLGMACYGIVKGLLNLDIEVDLIIPAGEEVYFRLRKEEDADSLPLGFVDSEKKKRYKTKATVKEIIGQAEKYITPYYTTGRRTWKKIVSQELIEYIEKVDPLRFLVEKFADDHALLHQVRNFTTMAVNVAKRLNFDVIHAHDWLAYTAGILLKRISGKPLIAHVHATEFDRAGGPGDRRIHDVEYIGLQLADKVITVSAYTANMIIDRYKVDANKVRIVHNAFTVSHEQKARARIFREPTVLFMGRMTIQKGPYYFLEVAKKVLQQEKNVRFIMTGSGDMEREVLHKEASLGLGTRFLFEGFLKRDKAEKLLAAADIFIMPSISEPFGIVPLEAMSHGAVAIVSKQSGVAEVIKNAYKVDFWDIDRIAAIILDLIKNPDKIKEISRKSMEEVAKLQWEEAAGKIKDVYKEVYKK